MMYYPSVPFGQPNDGQYYGQNEVSSSDSMRTPDHQSYQGLNIGGLTPALEVDNGLETTDNSISRHTKREKAKKKRQTEYAKQLIDQSANRSNYVYPDISDGGRSMSPLEKRRMYDQQLKADLMISGKRNMNITQDPTKIDPNVVETISQKSKYSTRLSLRGKRSGNKTNMDPSPAGAMSMKSGGGTNPFNLG